MSSFPVVARRVRDHSPRIWQCKYQPILWITSVAALFSTTERLAAQNLVPNPSFETYTICPTTYSQLNQAPPWSPPTGGSPDYFNACAGSPATMGVPGNDLGNQLPNSGNAYAGFILRNQATSNYREYIQAQLTSPLSANVSYDVSFYVSLSDHSQWGIDKIGAYFSGVAIGPVNNALPLPLAPHVSNPLGNFITSKTAWTLVSGTYLATGGENYIVIGNFYNDASTTPVVGLGGFYSGAYYYIDDVSVKVATSCQPPDPACHALLDPSCPNPDLLIPIDGGIPDEFCPPTEPAVPGAALASSAFCTNTVLKDFDGLGDNQKICHTITGIPGGIGAAILEIRLKPGTDSGVFNDSINLQLTPAGTNFEWSRRIGSDGPLTGLLGVPWTTTSPAFSRCLDLAALPNENGSTTDIIPTLVATGRLDIHVQDDSAVDYVRLWLAQCPCGPLPDGSACAGTCPNPSDTCKPTEMFHPASGDPIVTKCDCGQANECSVVAATNHGLFFFFCDGSDCPGTGTSQPCQLTSTPTAGGTTYECCNRCPGPLEACCLPFFQCQDEDPLCCVQQGGDPAGPGTTCTGPEECCYADGSNQIQDPACCLDSGGTPQGPGTGNVSLAPGACCLPTASPLGTCVEMNPYCCADLGGTFLGFFTECLGDNDGNGIDDACPAPCEPNAAKTACEGSCPSVACPTNPPGTTPINRCGTLEDGVTAGCVIFRSQGTPSNQYEVLNPAALVPFSIGDKLRICGYVNNTNPTTCQQGTPIVVNAVMACDAGENCQPSCLRRNLTTGAMEVLDCACRGPEACRAVLGSEGIECQGRCPQGKGCHRTQTIVTVPGTSTTYLDVCCDCEDVCPLPDPPQQHDPCRGFPQAQYCVDGEEDDVCVPHCAALFSNDFCPPIPPNLTNCDCACTAPGECGPVKMTGVGQPYYWNNLPFYHDYLFECEGECSPDQEKCELFHKSWTASTYNSTGGSSALATQLPAGFVKCDCDGPVAPSCAPNASGSACVGSCASGLSCEPTAVTCVPGTTNCAITRCACAGDSCRVAFPPPQSGPACRGTCDGALSCALNAISNPNGSTSYTCDCSVQKGHGDTDRNGKIDLRDYAIFQNCFAPASEVAPNCSASDMEPDGDVDLMDYFWVHGGMTCQP